MAGKCGGNAASAVGLAEASDPAGSFQFACGSGFLLKPTPETIALAGADAAAKKATCCAAVAGKCGGNAASAAGLAEASDPAGSFQFACGSGFLLKATPETIALAGADAAAKKTTCCAVVAAAVLTCADMTCRYV